MILDPYNPAHLSQILDLFDYELAEIQTNVDIQNAYPMPRSPQDSIQYAIAHCLYGDPKRAAAELRKYVYDAPKLVEQKRATMSKPRRTNQILPKHLTR